MIHPTKEEKTLKMTKKEVRELISGIKDTIKHQGWNFGSAGSYIKNNQVSLYACYAGQGIDSNIYEKTYDKEIEFTDVIKDYFNREMDLKDATNAVHGRIVEMIEDYKYENAEENDIGNNLKKILEVKGISIRKLSNDSNAGNYAFTHNLVNRDSLDTVTLRTLVNLAECLGVSIEDLYKGGER